MGDDEKDVPGGDSGAPMTPEEYAAFMSSDGDEEAQDEKKEDKDKIDVEALERVRLQLRQAGMITDYAAKVVDGIRDLKIGSMRDFNFVKGHVKRVRVKRELNGRLTVITY